MIVISFILFWIGMVIGLIVDNINIIAINGFTLISLVLLEILDKIKNK